eukprot:gb/GECG01008596.1/.p1 GENE.gb/GECG01008596.1/~~gb/GECG01008596.1/.p1  ORF type:complete len:418 (+),score=51.31 gb/GECG01008596.1/:1-1254(+)
MTMSSEHAASNDASMDSTNSVASAGGASGSCTAQEQTVVHHVDNVNDGGPCWKCQGQGSICKKRVQKPCTVCTGTGIIRRTKKRFRPEKDRIQTTPRKYAHFEAPGPIPPGDATVLTDPKLYPQEDEEVCFLAGKWKIFQKTTKHRYSTDDVVTAWVAWREAITHGFARPVLPYRENKGRFDAENPFDQLLEKVMPDKSAMECNYLDLGCGIGSVLLMIAWALPLATCSGVEAQLLRKEMAEKSVRYNGCSERVSVYQQDIQDVPALRLLLRNGTFDIITGTPPYFPSEQGGMPACAESAGCLFELKGGIEVYARAASALLKPETGFFVVVNTALARDRTLHALENAGLRVRRTVDAIPKEGKRPLFVVFVAKKDREESKGVSTGSAPIKECVTIRDSEGNRTESYRALLRHLGKPS